MYKDSFVFEVHPCAYKQLLPQLVPSGLKQCSVVAASTDELYENLAIIFDTPILFYNTELNIFKYHYTTPVFICIFHSDVSFYFYNLIMKMKNFHHRMKYHGKNSHRTLFNTGTYTERSKNTGQTTKLPKTKIGIKPAKTAGFLSTRKSIPLKIVTPKP